jgi:aminoglycoside 2'-N-acetyltransferase I
MLTVEHVTSSAMAPALSAEVRALCDAAYRTPTAPYFEALGDGDHLFGRRNGVLVSHLMWVTRWLKISNGPPLRTAYVEMVATAPSAERQGFASELLRNLVPLVQDFDIAALCPATESLYLRLGWRFWRGPLATRKDGVLIPTPEERCMVLPLARTPLLDLDEPLSVEWRAGEVW